MSYIDSRIEALVTADDLPNRLDVALAARREVARHRPSLSPEMSYGRHAGPAPYTARRASVVLLIFRRGNRWHLPLTERPATLAHHAGQFSLPGGAVEGGESSIAAGVRELSEELGFAAPHMVVGKLTDYYVFASDFLVSPWIIASYEPHTAWRPHHDEVRRVVELPLEVLLDDRAIGRVTIERGPVVFHAPCIRMDDVRIWGATCMILGELADLMRYLLETTT